MTRCSGRKCETPIAALSSRAGPTRCGPCTRTSGSIHYILGIFPERLRPQRRTAHRSSAAQPVDCRPPGRGRGRPRDTGPRKGERSRTGLDRTWGCEERIPAAASTAAKGGRRVASLHGPLGRTLRQQDTAGAEPGSAADAASRRKPLTAMARGCPIPSAPFSISTSGSRSVFAAFYPCRISRKMPLACPRVRDQRRPWHRLRRGRSGRGSRMGRTRLFRERGWTVSNFTSQVNIPEIVHGLIWRRDPRCAIRSLLPLPRYDGHSALRCCTGLPWRNMITPTRTAGTAQTTQPAL